MNFWRNVSQEKIWKLLESPKTQKNLPEFQQQELPNLVVYLICAHRRGEGGRGLGPHTIRFFYLSNVKK